MRESSSGFAIDKNQDLKDLIKQQVKELEDCGFISDLVESNKFGADFTILHAMFYCYVEPVSKLTNNKVKLALKAVQDKYDLQSFESFVKSKGAAKTEKKLSKDVQIENS